jgi:hypothetical protein
LDVEKKEGMAFEGADKVVALMYGTDTGRSAGVDEVASVEGDVLREVGDKVVGGE